MKTFSPHIFSFFTILSIFALAMSSHGAVAGGIYIQKSDAAIAQDTPPVTLPLTVQQDNYGTYKAYINVGLGNNAALPFVFDTGSYGLHVFSDAKLALGNAGDVGCTKEPTSVIYGNPPRVVFNGVKCYAVMHFANYMTPQAIAFSYLTSAACPPGKPDCTGLPDPSNYNSVKSYGIFGANIAGIISGKEVVHNPFLKLDWRHRIYSISLTPQGGTVVLGATPQSGDAQFQLRPGTIDGEKWADAISCIAVNGSPIHTCIPIAFDTGNGVPWIYTSNASAIPQQPAGYAAPNTRIGFGPVGSTQVATVLAAGQSAADGIRIVPVAESSSMTNIGIRGFFGHVVTYDNKEGIIYFSPYTQN